MREISLLAAFFAGLLGSAHCLGMCGGIAAALGMAAPGRRAWQPLLYHLGRLASYGAAGAVAGALGAAAGFAFELSRWSEILRLAAAAAVIVIGLDISLATGARTRWLRAPERWGAHLWRRLLPATRRRLPASPAVRALFTGLLWGWLPCGLLYSVLLAAAVAGGAPQGALTMVAFGLGTLPVMSGVSYASVRLPRPDGALARLTGTVLVACGLWTAIAPIAILTGAHEHHHTASVIPGASTEPPFATAGDPDHKSATAASSR